jgi:Divergent InlB B-repeat domain
MFRMNFGSLVPILLLASGLSMDASAQQGPSFVPGNLVVSVEGCGVHGGTCTAVPSGTGTGAGNSSVNGYGDNQAAPLTLFQYTPTGTSSVTYVNSLVLPQAISGANLPVSGEYGSSSEATLQLSGNGQYLTLMGYGVNAAAFDAAYLPGFTTDLFGAAPSGALGQSGSLTGQSYTTVPRVVALIDPFGNVNSSTALSNIFNTNNPRSIYTTDGVTAAYVSGQGTGCDLTGGVFLTPLGAPNSAPTPITGGDADPTSTCVSSGFTGPLVAQDTRDVQIYNNTLYISIDSTEGKSNNRSLIGTLGTPPATSLFSPTAAPSGDTGGPNLITGLGNTGGTGKETIATNGNNLNAGKQINLSPENYFFASPSVLYVADSGSPKQTSATSLLGNGGLQKWINSELDGSGTWSLAYTLYQGLNLVANTASNATDISGTTGLYGLAGTVSQDGTTVDLYATNFTISDLDPTFLYGITDVLSATTYPGTSFTQLEAAPSDSNFKGVSFAPSLPSGSATITSSPSGLAFTSAGSGCAPGTYTTPVTLTWNPGTSCTLSVVSPQVGAAGTQYAFAQWQDGTTGTSDTVTAPSTSAVYSAAFTTDYQLTTAVAGTGGTVSAGGFFAAGSNAVITATPSTGNYFVNFTGTTTSTSNPLTLPISGPESITANFAAQIAPTLIFAPIAAQLANAAPFAVTATSASTGTVTYAVTSGPATIAGNLVTVTGAGTVVLTANQAASGSYAAATATTSFSVALPTLTVPTLTFAPISSQVEGAAPFAVTATSASSGTVTYAVTSGPATITGNLVTVTGAGTVVLTANQAASGSYAAATATISFSVGMPFTLATASGTTAGSSGSSTSVAPGAVASFSLTLSPATGTTFPDPITFTATGLPPGATFTFSPAMIAAGSAATTVTLSIQTANTQTARNEQPITGNPLAPVALGFLLLPLLGITAAHKRLRQMPRLPLALLVVGLSLGAVLGISGCAGGSTPPTTTTAAPQTYTVAVTATDTTTKAQSSTNLTLTVQ